MPRKQLRPPLVTVTKDVSSEEFALLEQGAAKSGVSVEFLIETALAQEIARLMLEWEDRLLYGVRH